MKILKFLKIRFFPIFSSDFFLFIFRFFPISSVFLPIFYRFIFRFFLIFFYLFSIYFLFFFRFIFRLFSNLFSVFFQFFQLLFRFFLRFFFYFFCVSRKNVHFLKLITYNDHSTVNISQNSRNPARCQKSPKTW